MVKAAIRIILLKYCIPALLLLACLSYNTGYKKRSDTEPQRLYNKANQLFHLSNPSALTDSLALVIFQQVIDRLEKQKATGDTLLFFAYVKKGILLDIRDNYTAAATAYLKARDIKQFNTQWSDSLLYEISVYTGSVYYRMNNFDSASYFLLQAETLAQRYPGVKNKERLFNELGALYFENGNYLQSRNYFTHALEIVNNSHSADIDVIINIENNIALSNYKLGLYSQALSIYRKFQRRSAFTNQIFLNMGKAYRELGDYRQALACFRKVNYRETPDVLNELACTQIQLHRFDSAVWYLNRWTHRAARHGSKPNRSDAGINQLLRAEILVQQQQYEKALPALQKSVIAFSGHFNNADVYANPSSFTGTFTSYRLFDALFKKATTFEKLYQAHTQEKYLQAARSTYSSLVSLLRYIEKSYDTDDAKLFLKNNSQHVYRQAFLTDIHLHKLHPQAGYLEQAFITSEKEKASVMYAGISEKAFQKMPGIDPALVHKERNIKYQLARLGIKSDQVHDSATLEAIAKEKAAVEIELSQVQKLIEQNSAYYQKKYSESYPGIQSVREHLTPQQALISFYTTTNQLHVFVITASGCTYTAIDSFATLQQTITQWLTALRVTESGRKFKGDKWAWQLYRQLVQPVQALAGDKEQWIIIPDNILYFLPFESLPAGRNNMTLLETNEISYQFSARFVMAAPHEKQLPSSYSVLSFAPFALKRMPFPHQVYRYMEQLPASGQEIASLPGKSYTGSQATRQQFLKSINRYPVLHLATHAIADSLNSTASFIAFYPTTDIPADNALYLEEIYSLNLDATRLIIISACETGHGQLVNSEGVLSLARGFAYAGCPGIVSSLWKADDAATSVILQRFHIYLQEGYTKSKALRQAKLDYLHSNAIYKSPAYWAHLILAGDDSPVTAAASHTAYRVWGAAAIVLILAGVVLRTGRKKMKKVDVVS